VIEVTWGVPPCVIEVCRFKNPASMEGSVSHGDHIS